MPIQRVGDNQRAHVAAILRDGRVTIAIAFVLENGVRLAFRVVASAFTYTVKEPVRVARIAAGKPTVARAARHRARIRALAIFKMEPDTQRAVPLRPYAEFLSKRLYELAFANPHVKADKRVQIPVDGDAQVRMPA